MTVVRDIAIAGLIIALLILPFIALRWVPQLIGRSLGPKAKLATLAAGVVTLSVIVTSFWFEHQAICSNKDRGFECEISQVLITVLLFWWGLLVLTQSRFAWSAITSVRTQTTREA